MMQGSTLQWRAGLEGLRLGSLLISFQRFLRPGDDVIDRTPPSLGALPIGQVPNAFLLPLADNEAFWIGVLFPALQERDALALEAICGDVTTSLELPSKTGIIPGFDRLDGRFDVFCRQRLAELRIRIGEHGAKIHVTDPETYSACTGQSAPEPADPSAVYGGWLLP